MSSGSHLSKDSYDLIKQIGEAQSKQEEDKIMTQEYSILKSKMMEKNISSKSLKESLLKAIYLEMLGHDASFAYIHAVNQTQSKSINLKKMGYLACSLFFHENSEFLILLVSTIQKDLVSQNINEVMIALNVLSKLLCGSIMNALIISITNLLSHKNGIIRKKSIMIAYKIFLIQPQAFPNFDDQMKKALCDQDPSVMGAVLNIYHQQIKIVGPNKYKDIISSFVVILKQIIENKLSRDYDFHRMPAPWIQIKLLQIIGYLAANDQKSSEHVYEILGMTLTRADDTGINIGYSIVYQCIRTIAQIYPNPKQLESAALSIAKFFHSENNNLKYLGINSLKMLMNIDPKYAQNHQITVVESLESTDETLRRETLELLFKMTNQDNIEVIMEKLMGHLKKSNDFFFKKEMVNKIIQLIERYAPSQDWFFINTNHLFEFASEHISDVILNEIIKIIYEISQEDEDFNQLMFFTYEQITQKSHLSDPYVKLISWIFGQIGPIFYKNNHEKLNNLVDQLIQLIQIDHQDYNTQSWILNSLAKIQTKCDNKKKINYIFKKFQFSKRIDIQQRGIEYDLFPQFLENLFKSENTQKVDQSLSFLNNFVQKARDQGANEYKDTLYQKCFLNSQTSQQSQKLVFQPYSVLNSKSIVQNEQNETGLNIQGTQKWGKQGYIKEETKDQQTFQVPASNQTQSISSNNYTNSNSISSSNYKDNKNSKDSNLPVTSGGGVTQSSYVKNTFQPDLPVVQKQAFDPKEIQKQQLANQLFGKSNNQNKTFINKQNQQNQQKDLFELNDQSIIKYSPANISIKDFESYWEQMPDDLILDIQKSKIINLNTFQSFINQLNFKVVEIIDNEVICAGMLNQDMILLYSIIKSDGNFNVKIKANQQKDQQAISDQIKKMIS